MSDTKDNILHYILGDNESKVTSSEESVQNIDITLHIAARTYSITLPLFRRVTQFRSFYL